MTYKPSMAFSPAGSDACGYWRMWLPHINIPNSRFVFTQGIAPINDIAECDVLVVQRMMAQGNLQMLQFVRQHGIKIIFDLDDNLWTIPKFNPAHRDINSESAQNGLMACLEWADVITVSTKELGDVARIHTRHLRNVASKKPIPIVHIDNAVDLNLFEPAVWKRDPNKVVIGWGGSNTHSGDIAEVWDILPSIMHDYDNVYLECVGHDPPKRLIGHPRVRVRDWCHISEFAKRYATWNWDIVLAPLDSHKFNKSKSCIKMQEAGAIERCCLAQDIAPYQYFASFDTQLKWLLCNYGVEWNRKLRELIANKEKRDYLGKLMRKNVEEHFNITRTARQWEDACLLAFTS